jgi:FAD/FMN-containing dehydrogenase
MKNWDCSKSKFIEQSKEMENFFKEIEATCKKHGYSISHEDGHGAFEIEKYSDDNIDWLKNANFRLNGA